MRYPRAMMLLAVGLAVGAIGIGAALHGAGSAQALTNCTPPPDTNTAAEQEFLGLMNAARVQAGAVALKISPNLQRAALWKSADSSAVGSGLSHTDSLGRDTVSPTHNRAVECGYSTWAAEDIGYGFATAEAMFEAFKASPGHWANIMDPSMVVTGVALVYQGPYPAWTVDFGQVDDSASGGAQPTSTVTATPTSTAPGGGGSATSTSTPSPSPSPTSTATATPSPTATPSATPTHSTALNAGINLVTFEGFATPVQAATAGLGDNLLAVYAWNAATQRWTAYFPGAPGYANDLDVLNRGEAYYLIIRNGTAWQY